jgi:hypothetical protein
VVEVTEVTFQQRREVVVLEYASYETPETLVSSMFGGAPQGAVVGPLRWVDGVVLSFNPLPMNSEAVMKELIGGRLYWDHVSFAPMKTYQSNVFIRESGVTANVVDVSRNPVFRDIAEAIKQKFLADKVK